MEPKFINYENQKNAVEEVQHERELTPILRSNAQNKEDNE
jgi:hypothetical protein